MHLLRDGIAMRCTRPNYPIEVGLQRTGFIQIVMNLVANAVDAVGDAGNIEVSVREVHRHRANASGLERSAVIAVTDTGQGVVAPEHGDVFDAGYTTKGGTHNGLGLAMVWQIAERAGGSVVIESNPGVGTTVSVFLPMAEDTTRSGSEPVDVSDVSDGGATLGDEFGRASEPKVDHVVESDVAVLHGVASGNRTP